MLIIVLAIVLAQTILLIFVLRRLESLRRSVTSIRRKVGDLEPLPAGFCDCTEQDGRQKYAERYLKAEARKLPR